MSNNSILELFREEERKKLLKELLDEGYVHKSECPRIREDNKIRELKKVNNSLQRKITELQLELNVIKMMR